MRKTTARPNQAKPTAKAKPKAKPKAKTKKAEPKMTAATKQKAPHPAKHNADKSSPMWKWLEMKEQRLKMMSENRQNRGAQAKNQNQFQNQNDQFSKFSGPRRRAA